jgi:hypothetical protein
MLRIPRHGMVAQRLRHSFGLRTCLGKQDAGLDALSLREAAMRGIMSAAFILMVLILFLL